jgi:hypothetical protein
LLVRDSNGRPLTKLQLQKDVFGEAKKNTKTEIINYIMEANAIQTLEHIQSIKLTFMKLPLWCRK